MYKVVEHYKNTLAKGDNMFIKAIEIAASFTRPIYSIRRYYKSTDIHPEAATLVIVNSDGWAVTCAHVARQLEISNKLKNRYDNFKNELKARKGEKKVKQLLKDLEKKYGLKRNGLVEFKNLFFNCVEGDLNLEVRFHKEHDVALIRFSKFEKLLCDRFPVFAKNTTGLKQGKYLCRLGFPFPEFTNFTYDKLKKTIEWTDSGKKTTPQFPIEGMVTRLLIGNTGDAVGFEMSTPGLRGQSGGIVFDTTGKIWGMQSATGHLDLNFDINIEVNRDGKPKRIKDSAFLHVGNCVHIDILKTFLTEHNVKFDEE